MAALQLNNLQFDENGGGHTSCARVVSRNWRGAVKATPGPPSATAKRDSRIIRNSAAPRSPRNRIRVMTVFFDDKREKGRRSELEDHPYENMGAQLVREVASKRRTAGGPDRHDQQRRSRGITFTARVACATFTAGAVACEPRLRCSAAS